MPYSHKEELLLEIVQYEWGYHLQHCDKNKQNMLLEIDIEHHNENWYYQRTANDWDSSDKWIYVLSITIVEIINKEPLPEKYKEKRIE